jgi:tetratricopeptide (TPR) repeat protein
MKNRMMRLLVIAFLLLIAGPLLKAQSSDENYLDTPALIRKWPSGLMPIVVYIEPGNDIPGYHENYSKIAKQAFEDWADASNGKYAFTFVDDPRRATIQLTWTNDATKFPLHNESFQAGSSCCSFTESGIDNAKIFILTIAPDKGGLVNDNIIHWVCLHEVGHALGLSHSPSDGDVMFAKFTDSVSSKVPVLSERDRRTIAMLYSDAAKSDIERDATTKAGREKGITVVADKENDSALEAVNRRDFKTALLIYEKLIASNPTVSTYQENYIAVLNKAGNDAMAKRSFDTAFDYYEKAMKLDPHFGATRENLARCLLLKGDSLIRSDKPAEAETCYKKALDAVPDSKKDMLRYIVHNYAVALQALGRKQEADQLMLKYAIAP